jgi:hypothetical protein
MRKFLLTTSLVFSVFLTGQAFAKTAVSDETGESVESEAVQPAQPAPAPNTGEAAARKYFEKKPASDQKASNNSLDPDDHYLAIHLGGFFTSDSYKWGANDHVSNPGRLQGGITYRLSQLSQVDFALRADVIGYQFPDGSAVNLAFLPMLMFPDSASAFPIYFGLGLGPGVFLQQIGNESALSLNYEIVGGLRFYNVVGDTGFFVETGLKNEVHLLSDGQFNGFFMSVGVNFVF